MNERIKELLKQAHIEDDMGIVIFNAEKFAELIVKECCSVADEVERADTGMFVSWYLKAHFGVEE